LPVSSGERQEVPTPDRSTLASRIGGREFALKFAGIVVIVAGYLCGYLYWIDYLSLFNLHVGIFPKTTPEYFVLGGLSIYEAANSFLDMKRVGVIHVLGAILLTTFGIGIYVSTVVFLSNFVRQ
jgi:intracellular septation protein A